MITFAAVCEPHGGESGLDESIMRSPPFAEMT